MSRAQAGAYDGNDPRVTYSAGWGVSTSYTNTAFNTLNYTNVAGSTASFTFTGSRISLLYTMASNRGGTTVFIDGVPIESFSTYAPETRRQVIKTFTVSPGTHTIVVRADGNGYTDVDAFAVDIAAAAAGGTYDNTHSLWRYIGSWQQSSYAPSTNGIMTVSSNVGSVARFTFFSTNSNFIFSYVTTASPGKVKVTVDGIDYGTLDYFTSFEPGQQAIAILPVPARRQYHTVHLTVIEGTVNVDGISI